MKSVRRARSLVRLAGEGDLRELVGLYGYMHPPEDPRPRATENVAVWEEMLGYPGLFVLVAELEGRLVSTCTLVVVPNLTSGARPFGVLETVVTHPEHRRAGHGRAVLEKALAMAWERDCYKLMLQTGAHRDDAVAFYESVGFVRGWTTGFVARPPRREDP